MTVMVHSSLSRLGFVLGGAQTVVQALLDVVGPGGTLMMPTHSGSLCDPVNWKNPPVPESWWQAIRDEMPAFDPAFTPSRSMGAVVECFRCLPGVQRSNHPTVSAAAIGPNAPALLDNHDLEDRLGDTSPQGKLYDLDGYILLLGVDHGNNTSLHVSEVRSGRMNVVADAAPILVEGQRQWVELTHMDDDDGDFSAIGEAFAATGAERQGPIGAGVGRLIRSQEIVDFGVEWIQANRA
jgi:aminoglycoside 3-N-acetyltransferase